MTKFVRTREGKMIHLYGCPSMRRSFMPWEWAEKRDDELIWMRGTIIGSKFCKICDPCGASARAPLYDQEVNLITRAEARDLMLNHDARRVAVTQLEFMGHELAVLTSFVPVDHGPTHGTYTRHPACWCTEILGGPPDLDGNVSYSTSQDEATSLHMDVVAQALASGCDLR